MSAEDEHLFAFGHIDGLIVEIGQVFIVFDEHLVDIVVLPHDPVQRHHEVLRLGLAIEEARQEFLRDFIASVRNDQLVEVHLDDVEQTASLLPSLHHLSFTLRYVQQFAQQVGLLLHLGTLRNRHLKVGQQLDQYLHLVVVALQWQRIVHRLYLLSL